MSGDGINKNQQVQREPSNSEFEQTDQQTYKDVYCEKAEKANPCKAS